MSVYVSSRMKKFTHKVNERKEKRKKVQRNEEIVFFSLVFRTIEESWRDIKARLGFLITHSAHHSHTHERDEQTD
jgi:hypothetical protein